MSPSFIDLVALECIGQRRFLAGTVFECPYPLFGGQAVAQALHAASMTVPVDRLPHSLHSFFLRAGDTTLPTTYEVDVDRDGRSFSERRVVGRQNGRVIISMICSFTVPAPGPDVQTSCLPDTGAPECGENHVIPRLLSFEGRLADEHYVHRELKTRFWARCDNDLGDDPILHACAIAYLSDNSSGVAPLNTSTHMGGASIDHSLWFHRFAKADQWLLLDLVPREVADGRGWYTGSVFTEDGRLAASMAQETLFREGTGLYHPHGP